jgi:hypothetical protein
MTPSRPARTYRWLRRWSRPVAKYSSGMSRSVGGSPGNPSSSCMPPSEPPRRTTPGSRSAPSGRYSVPTSPLSRTSSRIRPSGTRSRCTSAHGIDAAVATRHRGVAAQVQGAFTGGREDGGRVPRLAARVSRARTKSHGDADGQSAHADTQLGVERRARGRDGQAIMPGAGVESHISTVGTGNRPHGVG